VPILFDLDGTLADPRKGIISSLKFAIAQAGLEVPTDAGLEETIGSPIHRAMAALLATSDDSIIAAGVAAYRDEFSRIGIDGNSVYPGIIEALRALRQAGATLYVATSKAQQFAEKIVVAHGLSGFFQGVYGSELDGTRSDKGELIAYLLQRESLSPDACTMVGDRGHDVLGARANGVSAVGVLWGFGSREEFSACGTEKIIEHPAQLLSAIG
jgi:phosphoglycolate phosphatase